MSSLPAEQLDRVRQTLSGHPGVRVALVFGSRARGTARSDSDLDLAIVGQGFDSLLLQAELARATGLEVDVVDLSDPPIPLLAAIVREGIVVFERRRGAAAMWRSHALADLELDLPWFRRMRDAWLARVSEHGV